MDLEKIYSTLENVENGSELINGIKEHMSKLRNEAAAHRRAKEEEMAKRAELQTLIDSLNAEKGSGDSKVAQLEKQIEALNQKYEAAENARKEAEEKRINADILAQTVDVLTKNNAMSPKDFAKLIVGNVTVNEDGTYSYIDDEGNAKSIEEGAKAWLSSRAWAVRDTQHAGSGEGRKNMNANVPTNASSFHDAVAKAISQSE